LLCGQNTSSTFHQFSKKNGLSQASVFAIAQDSAGFMWFGTRNGLNKFDGYRFKVYNSTPSPSSLISDDIRNLYVDPLSHDIWVGSFTGLSQYNAFTDQFINYRHIVDDKNSLISGEINQVLRDRKGRLWVATAYGLNLYDEETEGFTRLFIEDLQSSGTLHAKAILEDVNGELLIGTNHGLFKLIDDDVSGFSIERINDLQLNEENIKCLAEDSKGNVWIGTVSEGLNYWDRSINMITSHQSQDSNPLSLSHNSIRSFCLDQKDNLWVGTFDGLNFLEAGMSDFKVFKKNASENSGLSDKSVRSVMIDNKGSLWAGTYYGGVNHLDNNEKRFKNVKHNPDKNSLSADVVSSFAEDADGNLWIGTEGGGLNYYESRQNEFNNFQLNTNNVNSLPGNNVKDLLLDGYSLWIGTFQAGLALYHTANNKFKYFKNDPNQDNSLSNNNVYGLAKEKDKLWILTYGDGLDVLDLNEDKFYHFTSKIEDKNSINSGLTRVILQTSDKQFWIGTDAGLNQVNVDHDGLPASFNHYLSGEQIYSLQKNGDHSIWVGTFTNGLFQFNIKTKEVAHYTTDDGLSGNSIFGIIEVSQDELWLSTNNGITKFDQKENTFTNYDLSNGIANLEHNFNAYYKTRSGEILFGGTEGFTQFHPEDIVTDNFIPPVVLTRITQNNLELDVQEENSLNQDINVTKEIKLKYNEANISIGFAALDYFSPENNRYAYMLKGLDKEWNYSIGQTEANYVIQREGDYTFKVKGANSDGIWNPDVRTLQITVLPPFYRTWWAYILYALLFMAAVYALFRFIRLRHHLQLEQLTNQKKEELHEMKLRFFTNITHEFRTPLTLIIGPLRDLLLKENDLSSDQTETISLIEKNAQRLLNLVNQLMTFRKLGSVQEIQIAQHNIVSVVNDVFSSFEPYAHRKKIDYQFRSEGEISDVWIDHQKIEKVCSNLIFNALKFTPEGGRISVEITDRRRHIEISVEDSGPGVSPELHDQIFKRFYEKPIDQSSAIKGTGIGLAISKQMIELHGGRIYVMESESTGATFVVELLKGDEHFGDKVTRVIHRPTTDRSDQTEVISIPEQQELISPVAVTTTSDRTALPLLLIVEDNAEIRLYIQQIFNGVYRFITAKNGQEGLKQAKYHMPELIISDIMMPVMDGITFCTEVKTDIELSHIPVILLTARIDSISKIEGLKTGADDYVTKPFNPEEIRLRVRNIILTRQKIKDRFARSMKFDPKEINVTSADEALLINAMNIVENNIGNVNFNVMQFATELTVSRSLLFSKLKALTGQTPNNFIKTIRLKRAAQLLETQKLQVSVIAYKVGFKDPKYFRKCFKEQFDVNPSEFYKNPSETL